VKRTVTVVEVKKRVQVALNRKSQLEVVEAKQEAQLAPFKATERVT
jgi:hypothetical protein